MSFFPDDIDLSEIQSPTEILEEAREEWARRSDGMLDLIVIESDLSDSTRSILDVILTHSSSGRQAKLLSLRHVPDQAYPLEIVPESFNYPDYLVKKRFVPARKKTLLGPSILDSLGELIPEHTVTNKWVCETPREFRQMLAEALSLGSVKSLIVNLVAGRAIREIRLSEEFSENSPIADLDYEDP